MSTRYRWSKFLAALAEGTLSERVAKAATRGLELGTLASAAHLGDKPETDHLVSRFVEGTNQTLTTPERSQGGSPEKQ